MTASVLRVATRQTGGIIHSPFRRLHEAWFAHSLENSCADTRPVPDDTYLPPHCPTHPLQGQASLGVAPALAALEVASPAPVADVAGLLEGPASFWRKQSAKVEKVLTEAPPGEWVCVQGGCGVDRGYCRASGC